MLFQRGKKKKNNELPQMNKKIFGQLSRMG